MTIDFSHFSPTFVAQFGESITYVKTGPISRTIFAVVEREPPVIQGRAGTLTADPSALRPDIEVWVQNRVEEYDAVAGKFGGISAGELDKGTDKLMLPRMVGGTPEGFTIMRVSDQDAGMLRLEVR